MKTIFIFLIFSLFVGSANLAYSQYSSSMGNTMMGNSGISVTLNDPIYGGVASFSSIHTGSSFDNYYAAELAALDRKFADMREKYGIGSTQSSILYEPGYDTQCDGELVTIDEMLDALSIKNLYVESELDYQYTPFEDDSKFLRACYITIHALDDSFTVSYDEFILLDERLARDYYGKIIEADLQRPTFSQNGKYVENNLGLNSIFISAEAGDDGVYMQDFQKDEYVVRITSAGYDGVFLLKGTDVAAWGEVVRSRVNTAPFDHCTNMSVDDVQRIFFENGNTGKMESKLYDANDAKAYAEFMPPGAIDACVIEVGFPHLNYGLRDAYASFFIVRFPTTQDAENMVKELASSMSKPASIESGLLVNNPNVSEYNILRDGNQAGLFFADKNALIGVNLKGNDFPKGSPYAPWGFNISDTLIRTAANIWVDNYFGDASAQILEPINESAVSQPTTRSSGMSINYAIPSDQQGRSTTNVIHGSLSYIKVSVISDSRQSALVTVSVIDNDGFSLGTSSVKTILSPGETEMQVSVPVPTSSSQGNAQIFANVLTDWPTNHGFPLTAEKQSIMQITPKGSTLSYVDTK